MVRALAASIAVGCSARCVAISSNHLTQLGKEYSSNIESDGPVSLELSDMDLDWISLANGNEYTSGCFEAAMHSDFYSNRSHQLAAERYTAMIAKDLPLENQIYVFDQYGTDHFRIITEDHSLEGLHEALFTVMITTDKKDILIDSGATSSVNVFTTWHWWAQRGRWQTASASATLRTRGHFDSGATRSRAGPRRRTLGLRLPGAGATAGALATGSVQVPAGGASPGQNPEDTVASF